MRTWCVYVDKYIYSSGAPLATRATPPNVRIDNGCTYKRGASRKLWHSSAGQSLRMHAKARRYSPAAASFFSFMSRRSCGTVESTKNHELRRFWRCSLRPWVSYDQYQEGGSSHFAFFFQLIPVRKSCCVRHANWALEELREFTAMEGLKDMIPLNFFECALCISQYCCGALFGIGFCAYYFFEVVKVSWRCGLLVFNGLKFSGTLIYCTLLLTTSTILGLHCGTVIRSFLFLNLF